MRLQDRVAIVTGGGKGIGSFYARGLAREGAAVVVAEIDAAAARRVADEITEDGGRALAVPTDVASETSVRAMVEQTISSYGRVDILVNNAAMFASVAVTHAPFDQLSVDEWDRVMAVNVRGVWLCAKEVIPHMRRQQYGKIINISSGTVWKGTPGFMHYVASKGAVAAMTRVMANEAGPGICVNTIAPGFTESENALATHVPGQAERAVQGRIIKRAEVPEDLVGTVLFLSSADSDFITGQTIHVDGGSVLS